MFPAENACRTFLSYLRIQSINISLRKKAAGTAARSREQQIDYTIILLFFQEPEILR